MKINIDKNAIPYQFDIELGGELFTFDVDYNKRFDFFTFGLYKDGSPVVINEKMVYGRELFLTVASYEKRLPKFRLLPFDESGQPVEAITWDNFNETVILLVGELDG